MKSPQLLILEDIEIQIRAARRSIENGHYATALAELNGVDCFLAQLKQVLVRII